MAAPPSIDAMRRIFSSREEPLAGTAMADAPPLNVVVTEIGILLALHLAIALAVCLTVGSS
jgi:hypothetical protein